MPTVFGDFCHCISFFVIMIFLLVTVVCFYVSSVRMGHEVYKIPILLRLQVSPGGGGAPAAGGRLTNLNLKKAPAHAHEVTLAGDSSRERETGRESRFHELATVRH